MSKTASVFVYGTTILFTIFKVIVPIIIGTGIVITTIILTL